MKSFLKHLCLTIIAILFCCTMQAKAGVTASTILNTLDISDLNKEQEAMFKAELTAYTASMDTLAKTDMAAWKKKLNEMLVKIRDGFTIYRLSRSPDVEKQVLRFDSLNRGAKIHIYSYMQDGFLNNVFQRLAKAFYAIEPGEFINVSYVFHRSGSYTENTPFFLPAPEIDYSLGIKQDLAKTLTETKADELAGSVFVSETGYSIIAAELQNTFTESVRKVVNAYTGIDALEVSGYSSSGITLTAPATFVTPWGEPFTLPKGAIVLHSCNASMYSDNYFLHDFYYNGVHYTWNTTSQSVDGYTYNGSSPYNRNDVLESPVAIVGAVKNVVLVDQNPFQTEIPKPDGSFEKASSLTLSLKQGVLASPILVKGGSRSLKHFKDVSAVTLGQTIQTQSVSSPCEEKLAKPKPVSGASQTNPAIEAYVKDGKLQNWLKAQGISGSVWITNCKTGNGYVINGTQTTASSVSKAEADAIVKGKKFNGDIGISACYDPDSKQWSITHAFKDDVLNPKEYAGELKMLQAVSNMYVDNVIRKKNGEDNESGTASTPVNVPEGFKYDDLGILEAVLAVKDFTKQIVNTAKVPEEYWDDTKPEYKTSPVNVPPLFCGAGDQGLENATELVQLLDLGLTLATEPETAGQMWSSIKNVKIEDVKKLAVGVTGYENYKNGGSHAYYQGGKHAVVIVLGAAVLMGKSLKTALSELDEGVEAAVKKADDDIAKGVGKNGDEITPTGTKNEDDLKGNNGSNIPDDPWNLKKQKLGSIPDSKVLGENLEAVGKVRPPNSHAHHITAGRANDPFVIRTRELLKREGIDINEASNGVFLPANSKYKIDDASPHANVHTKVYYEEVFNRLDAAPQSKVREELQKIADELLSGTFPY